MEEWDDVTGSEWERLTFFLAFCLLGGGRDCTGLCVFSMLPFSPVSYVSLSFWPCSWGDVSAVLWFAVPLHSLRSQDFICLFFFRCLGCDVWAKVEYEIAVFLACDLTPVGGLFVWLQGETWVFPLLEAFSFTHKYLILKLLLSFIFPSIGI